MEGAFAELPEGGRRGPRGITCGSPDTTSPALSAVRDAGSSACHVLTMIPSASAMAFPFSEKCTAKRLFGSRRGWGRAVGDRSSARPGNLTAAPPLQAAIRG